MNSDQATWSRLSPFAIVYFTGRTLASLLNGLPVLAAGFIAVIQNDLPTVILYSLALVVLVLLFSTLSYINFFYLQEADRFLVREGVLSRNRVEIPFRKIQNINIKQPFYFRPFGLVVLSIDSAGSVGKEIEFAALSRAEAARVQETILAYVQIHSDGEVKSESVVDHSGGLLLERSTLDVALHGFTHNRAWFLLAFLAPVFGQMDSWLGDVIKRGGVDIESHIATATVFGLLLLGSILVVGLFVFFSALSVAGAVLALHRYQLFFKDKTYVRKSGLLNRYEIQVKQSRIQTVKMIQTGLDRVFKRFSMVLEPFSAGQGEERRNGFMQRIMVPSLTETEAQQMVEHVFPGLHLNQVVFKRISPWYLHSRLWFFAIPISLVVSLNWRVDLSQALLAFCVTLVICMAGLALRWARYGVGTWRGHVVVRSGWIGTSFVCLPTAKVQQIKFIQSVFLRKKNLASLQFVTASRLVTLPYIPSHYAEHLTDLLLAKLEFNGESWM